MAKTYIVFVRTNMFDHEKCLKENSTIDWWISPQPKKGDIYYIYKGAENRVIAKTEVVRTQLKKADTNMKQYYDEGELASFNHPIGYNPMKCMRLKLVKFIDKDSSFEFLRDQYSLSYPKHSNRQQNITHNKELIKYLGG